MMRIHVKYHNILRQRAGTDGETLRVPVGSSVRDVLRLAADTHGPLLEEMLFAASGAISSHLVVFRDRTLLRIAEHDEPLADDVELLLFPAIAGG
ncbi:MAG: MoaD/ThiS family protein [Chloroflexi bacterium]|nr:MoaD/ThiS family protein [Chloroflexota bacterium]